MSDALPETDKDAEDTVAKKTSGQKAAAKTDAQKADEALREAQSTKSEMAVFRQEVMGGFADLRSSLMGALLEAVAAKSTTAEDGVVKRKADVKGRVVSDDELRAFVERISSDDAARMHEFIAEKAENEKWAARGINPATHVIATEALKLMYDGKPIFTVPEQVYERAKLSPLDLEQYGETHFTAPKLKK